MNIFSSLARETQCIRVVMLLPRQGVSYSTQTPQSVTLGYELVGPTGRTEWGKGKNRGGNILPLSVGNGKLIWIVVDDNRYSRFVSARGSICIHHVTFSRSILIPIFIIVIGIATIVHLFFF